MSCRGFSREMYVGVSLVETFRLNKMSFFCSYFLFNGKCVIHGSLTLYCLYAIPMLDYLYAVVLLLLSKMMAPPKSLYLFA